MIAEKIAINASLYPLTNEKANMVQNYNLKDAVEALRQGGLILYPTDTIWGIGCDATNAQAVKKVYDLKRRDYTKTFVLLADSIQMLKEYVAQLHPRLETLLTYHQRPLTVVYDNAINLPSNVIAKDGSIAIRIPQDRLCQQLIRAFGRPLVATSANISNEAFPNHFGEISSEVIQGVDYVIKYKQGEKEVKTPSVIVKLSDPIKAELVFLRE